MKRVTRSLTEKHFLIVIFFLSCVLMACGQDNKSKKGTIEPKGKVNMKELQEKEKRMQPDSLKPKYETGPPQDTASTALPVPKNAVVKKTEITPGQMKRDSTQQKKKEQRKQ